MITIFLGMLGSGKTASAVRELVNDKSGRITYSNLAVRNIKNVYHIKPQDIISKTEDEKGKITFDLNKEFWLKQKKPLNILWDEIHLTANSRKSMSNINMVFSKFMAMARRLVGFDKRGYGHLIFIAQAERTIDVNIKELASEIRYHKSYWIVKCEECSVSIIANSEMEQIETCLNCGSWKIERKGLNVEVRHFRTWGDYMNFKLNMPGKWHNKRYMIKDMADYFGYYDTMQMEDIWADYIEK